MATPFPNVPDLTGCLQELIAQIPVGRVATCGDVADALGSRMAARWVGYVMLHHHHDAACPCHRIVRAGGQLGAYIAGTVADKARRLEKEGIRICRETVDLDSVGFRPRLPDRPLERLRKIQQEIQSRIVVGMDCPAKQPAGDAQKLPELVGGVDVAYPSAETGAAAFALVETDTGRLVWSKTVCRPVTFPYISTYLSFREIPILLELLAEVRGVGRMPEVLLVDGSGVLHQRRAGIASHLGVVSEIPTIGVTKKLLCGAVDFMGICLENEPRRKNIRLDFRPPATSLRGRCPQSGFNSHANLNQGLSPGESRPVLYQAQVMGVAIRPTAGSCRPIFISPGHRVDVAFSERLVRALLHGHRLPEPLYWADRLSKQAAKSP